MNRIVTYARLQASVFVPGLADIGPQLPPRNKVIQGFKMIATDIGLKIHGAGIEAFVPWPNVQVVVLGDPVLAEEKKPSPSIIKGKPEAA